MTTRMSFLAGLVLSAARLSPAQDLSTPEAVAGQAMKAMNAQDHAQFASYMHPEALKTFRKLLSEILDAAAANKADAEMLGLFHEAKSVAALKELSDAQFFASFLRGVMGRIPNLKEALGGAEFEILGHVKEGPDVVHVVTRIKIAMGSASMKKMSVISLRQDGKSWKMLLTGELEGLAASLKARQLAQ
jgi:hypothetical protein